MRVKGARQGSLSLLHPPNHSTDGRQRYILQRFISPRLRVVQKEEEMLLSLPLLPSVQDQLVCRKRHFNIAIGCLTLRSALYFFFDFAFLALRLTLPLAFLGFAAFFFTAMFDPSFE